jgi:hypothetical protein
MGTTKDGSTVSRKSETQSGGNAGESLIKSRERVADHGEVFTPQWMVEDMLDLVKAESERIDSRFLEPACGSGNFLKPVLQRKLDTVQARYRQSDFERKHYALFALMCVYGIELLEDNVEECRQSLLEIFNNFVGLGPDSDWSRAAKNVLEANIIHGDALTLLTPSGAPISFPEWGYIGIGKFQRRDFRYDSLTQRSAIEGSLFEFLEEHEVFIPVATYEPMTMREIAG